MKSLLLVETVIGRLGLVAEGDYLTAVYFEHESRPPDLPVRETALLSEARAQLMAYFAGQLRTFTLPLAPAAAFQRRVWQVLRKSLMGRRSAIKRWRGGLEREGHPGGGAGQQPKPIADLHPLSPGDRGQRAMVGYGGGLGIKEKLLALEKGYLKGKSG